MFEGKLFQSFGAPTEVGEEVHDLRLYLDTGLT